MHSMLVICIVCIRTCWWQITPVPVDLKHVWYLPGFDVSWTAYRYIYIYTHTLLTVHIVYTWLRNCVHICIYTLLTNYTIYTIYIYIHEDFFHEQKDQFDQFISRLMDKKFPKNQVFQTGRVAICENFQGIPAFKTENSRWNILVTVPKSGTHF